jgi:hypothetical protein
MNPVTSSQIACDKNMECFMGSRVLSGNHESRADTQLEFGNLDAGQVVQRFRSDELFDSLIG